MTTISVIVGSTRQNRFSEKPAQWIHQELRKREEIEARLLDLRDFPMPFFDEPLPPAMPGRPPYEHDVVKKWTGQIAASDGFVFVTPEYNYGPSAVLKNAIDWIYPEWNRKAAAFVSYGSAMGARVVRQLRTIQNVIEIRHYGRRAGKDVFDDWLTQLADARAGWKSGPAGSRIE